MSISSLLSNLFLDGVAREWASLSSTDIDTCERFVERISKRVLNPNHHFVIKVKSHLVMLYSMKENEVLSVAYFT